MSWKIQSSKGSSTSVVRTVTSIPLLLCSEQRPDISREFLQKTNLAHNMVPHILEPSQYTQDKKNELVYLLPYQENTKRNINYSITR